MPGLGRHVYFDERSRNYPMRALLPREVERVDTIWDVRPNPLDQGQEGACVGFAFSGELACTPVVYDVSDAFAFDLYEKAREQDRHMGNNFPSGATLLAGVKACVVEGTITEYRWAFGTDDVIDTICTAGPVVVGIPWYDGMYTTREDNLVRITGEVVGGHAILVHGYVNHDRFGPCFVWTNSWGSDYADNGTAYIRVADLGRLLAEQGEACVPVDAPLLKPEPSPDPSPVPAPVPDPDPAPEPAPITFWQWLLRFLKRLFA